MAEGKIKKDDIIDSGLFDDAIKSADLFLAKAKELESQLKDNLTTSKEFLNNFKQFDSKGLSNLTAETSRASRTIKDLEQVQQNALKTEKLREQVLREKEKTLRESIKTEQAFEKAVRDEQKTLDANAKALKENNSAYARLKSTYNDLSKAQIELSVRGRENGKVFKAIKQEADALRATLDKAEQGAGRFQRNVGNYASGFDSLGNSLNNITRELPAFAVSAQTGFLAVSNNLPILFDQLQKINAENEKLIAQGKPIESAFSKVGKSLLSTTSLLSIGVTLLTLFGAKIIETVANLFNQADAFDLNAEAMKLYNAEIERTQKAQDDLDKSIGKLQKDIIKYSKLVSEAGGAQLDAIDAATDKFLENEKARKKAIFDIVVAQLQSGNKEIEIKQQVTKDAIIIENKKNGEIIKLDRDLKNVLETQERFFGKKRLTINEKIIQDKLEQLNRETQIFNQKLDDEYTLELENAYKTEDGKSKIRQKFSDEDLIKKRSDADRIRQLRIDGTDDEKQREIELALFKNEKAQREIDDANKIELEKKRIAKANYLQEKELILANVKDVRQQKIDLLK